MWLIDRLFNRKIEGKSSLDDVEKEKSSILEIVSKFKSKSIPEIVIHDTEDVNTYDGLEDELAVIDVGSKYSDSKIHVFIGFDVLPDIEDVSPTGVVFKGSNGNIGSPRLIDSSQEDNGDVYLNSAITFNDGCMVIVYNGYVIAIGRYDL